LKISALTAQEGASSLRRNLGSNGTPRRRAAEVRAARARRCALSPRPPSAAPAFARPPTPSTRTRSVLDDLGEEITGIAAPVAICMALVVLLVRVLNPEGLADTATVFIATIAYTEQVGICNRACIGASGHARVCCCGGRCQLGHLHALRTRWHEVAAAPRCLPPARAHNAEVLAACRQTQAHGFLAWGASGAMPPPRPLSPSPLPAGSPGTLPAPSWAARCSTP
jgi:hypothetical protein